jgi:thiosulfate/3-mercaptopyruvate sulfurtransferase
MAFTTLISTDALAVHLADPEGVIVDCRFKLEDPTWGERDYEHRHIPGATYAHLDRDLSGAKTGRNGRHPLPTVDVLTATFNRWGLRPGTQVSAYDQDTGMFASRLWWLLRWLGHDRVAVLDGGFAKWIAERRPTSTGIEHKAPGHFVGAPRLEMVVGADEISDAMRTGGWRLLDARAPERYRGETEPLDKVAGHIPTAANHFFQQNLDDRGLFRAPDALRARLGAAIGETSPQHVMCYCGSGVTACHNLLALEHAGLSGAKLYPGSWSEWSSDPSRPVEKHEGPA